MRGRSKRAELAFKNFSKECKERRDQAHKATLEPPKTMWQKVKHKVLPPKPPPVHCLTLDERALIEAEDEELKKLPKLARQLFRQYVSPMKDAVKDHTAAGWSPYLNTPIYGLALVVILSCALYVFLFTIQINKCGGCERHNDMFHDPATKLPRWANTTWAIDEKWEAAGRRPALRPATRTCVWRSSRDVWPCPRGSGATCPAP